MKKRYILFMQGQATCVGVFKRELSGNRILVQDPCYIAFRVTQDEDGTLRGGVDIQPWIHNIALPEGDVNEWEVSVGAICRANSLDPTFIPVYEGAVAMTSQRQQYTENKEIEVPKELLSAAENTEA